MRVANVQDGYLDLSEVKNIVVSPNDAEKCLLQKGDVLLTEGGDPDKLGRGYIWNNEVEQCLHQNHIFSVRIKDQSFVKPEFLSALISSPRGKRYFLKVGKQTTGIATINKTVLSEFVTFIPPIEIQQKYIDIKNKIDKQKLNFNKGDLSLFDSLSQKAFSGKL
jgi:type I restriction enzyme S subunit